MEGGSEEEIRVAAAEAEEEEVLEQAPTLEGMHHSASVHTSRLWNIPKVCLVVTLDIILPVVFHLTNKS